MFQGEDPGAFTAQAKALPAERVLAKGRQLFSGDRVSHGAPFVDVDRPQVLPELGIYLSTSQKSLRALLEKNLPEPKLAQDENGGAHWLVPKEEARAALKAAGIGARELREQERDDSSSKKRAAKDRKRQKAKGERGQALVDACLAKLRPISKRPDVFFDVVAAFVLERVLSDVARAALSACDVKLPQGNVGYLGSREKVAKWLAALPQAERVGAREQLVLELMLRSGMPGSWDNRAMTEPLATAVRALKIDPAKALASARKKASEEKAKAPARPRARPSKR